MLSVKLKWSKTGLSQSNFRKLDRPERSPHAKLSCELKSSFFSEVSRAFVPVRMLLANQIAERSQYALPEGDKQKDKQVRQLKDGNMQKAQNRSVPPRL